MKAVVAAVVTAVLAVLTLLLKSPGVSPVASWGDTTLAHDLHDFEELLLSPRVVTAVLHAFAVDSDAGQALRFINTARFRRRCLSVEAMPETQELSELLAAEGVGLRTSLRHFAEGLELEYRRARRRARKRLKAAGQEEPSAGNLRQTIEDLKTVLPAKAIQQLYHDKMKSSEPFRKFVQLLNGNHGQKILKKLTSFREYQTLKETLTQRGLDIYELAAEVKWLFIGGTPPAHETEAPKRPLFKVTQQIKDSKGK